MPKYVTLAALLLAATATAAHAQAQDPMYGTDMHVRAFTNGTPKGWTVGAPHLDIAAGYYDLSNDGTSENAAFFRAHLQMAIASPVIQVSSDIQFVPKFTKADPTASIVLQLAPIPATSAFYLSGGIGLITGHTSTGAAAGWVQAQLAYRTPIHVVTLFGQIGKSLNSGSGTELLIGVQHPLAPYKLHGLKS
ncbi:MAG TPA: hypothetical protein VGM77_02625 [Gemmatimonadales bacterium]